MAAIQDECQDRPLVVDSGLHFLLEDTVVEQVGILLEREMGVLYKRMVGFQAHEEECDGNADEKQVGNNNCWNRVGKTESNTRAVCMKTLGQRHRGFAVSQVVNQERVANQEQAAAG